MCKDSSDMQENSTDMNQVIKWYVGSDMYQVTFIKGYVSSDYQGKCIK